MGYKSYIKLLFCIICAPQSGENPKTATMLVFKHGKIAGDPAKFKTLLNTFEKENPGIIVRDEILPASTDEQHQFYVINLEGKSSDFDVISMDVIWVPEFARAGWLRKTGHLLNEKERKDFFPGPMNAVAYKDEIYAIPWGDIAAASVVVTVPLILIVFAFQRRIIEGFTTGAIKG